MATDSVFQISRPLTVDVFVTSVWNALVSISILALRSWKLRSMDDSASKQPQFFDFYVCSIVFLVSLCYCGAFCKLRPVTREWLTLLTKFGWCLPVFFHCASVLLGAPFLKDSIKTMSFALLVTGLVLPSVVTDLAKAAAIVQFSRLEWVRILPVSTLTGAWLAAAVIPLDWDRPWQVWPEPSCIGAAAATAVQSVYDIVRVSASRLGAGSSHHIWKQRRT